MENMEKQEYTEKKLLELEHDERNKELDLLFKSVFKQAQEILKRQVTTNPQGKLHDLIELCQTWIIKLSDPNDLFLKKYKSLVDTYKSGLDEFKNLLLIFEKIEEEGRLVKSLKISDHQQRNKALLTEIKFSEKRLQRMRAGVKLAQVLQESLQKKFMEVEAAKVKELKNNKQMQILPVDDHLNDTEEEILDNLESGFNKQKHKVDILLKESYKGTNSQIDFTNKYHKTYLQNYFKERYKLANHFLGDQVIKQFLITSEKFAQDNLKERSNGSIHHSGIEKTFVKDLDAKNFIQPEDVERNQRALQKILRVNQEIRQELIEEDHKQNLEAITQFEIQQKQTYWDKVLSQGELRKTKSSANLLRKPSNQNLHRVGSVEKRTIKIKPIVSSLKKREMFYQAHPQFPLISETYNTDDFPVSKIKQSAIQYEIHKDPARLLTLDEEIFPQQARMRTPNIMHQSRPISDHNINSSNAKQGIVQPFFSRTAYCEFKSLTTLWGGQWTKY